MVSTTLYEQLLGSPVESLNIERAVAMWPTWDAMERRIRATHDDPMVTEKALEECRAKHLDPDELKQRLERFRREWPTLSGRLRDQLLTSADLEDHLRRAHCPTRPEEIGLTMEQLRESYVAAGQIRRRYTVFDVVNEAGLLDGFIDAAFSPDGFWSRAIEA